MLLFLFMIFWKSVTVCGSQSIYRIFVFLLLFKQHSLSCLPKEFPLIFYNLSWHPIPSARKGLNHSDWYLRKFISSYIFIIFPWHSADRLPITRLSRFVIPVQCSLVFWENLGYYLVLSHVLKIRCLLSNFMLRIFSFKSKKRNQY